MSQGKPSLLLFDANALIHRAFHALPGLSTKSGQPTGAIYGFVTMLLKTLEELKPSYCAVAFDSAAPTFRHIEFQDYKAHRPKTPDELVSQFGLVREIVQAFNIPQFEIAGFEADDILGALSQQASAQGVDTTIVTGDTDMLQLVSPSIRVLLPKPKRPFSDTQIYDEQAVQERYNLNPQQLSDLKGLKGDPSDNIPGVPGIGEKTAQKLISEFGSIEDIYRRIDEVMPLKLRENLRANEPAARQSKKLATIDSQVPVKLDLPACQISDHDHDKVNELFRKLELFTLLDRISHFIGAKNSPSTNETKTHTNYTTLNTSEALDALLPQLAKSKAIAIDTETTGLNARNAGLVGISICTEQGKAWYIPVGHQSEDRQLPLAEVAAKLDPVLQNPKIPKITHNGKYDIAVLANHGMEVGNLASDTMIAAYLLGEKSLGLKQLVFNKLAIKMTPITDLIGSGTKQKSMAEVGVGEASEYACADADMTFRLNQLLETELKEQGLWRLFSEVEMPLVPILCQMEKDGIALDAGALQKMSRELAQEIGKTELAIYNAVGHQFNINSSQQLGRILFEELKLPTARKTKSGYSTDMSVLEGLKPMHPVVGSVIEYRQLTKLKSTYIDALPALIDPKTGRVHTSFNQTVAATGRLSSSDPNLQNIPIRTELGKRIRLAFIAPNENFRLISADYSQIELRVMAHLSQDPGLLAAFTHDEDIHSTTAAQVFGVEKSQVTPDMRRVAKVVNFGVIYGMSDYGLEQASGFSRRESADFIKTYFEKYRGVQDYINITKRQAAEKGYVQTVLGRKRFIPDINSSNYQVRQAAERMAINMPVQGTAADIIKLAMIKIYREMNAQRLQSKMILQVHDELLFEVPMEELEAMKGLIGQIMPRAMDFTVPLRVEIKEGRTWGEME
ncbi:MAG: DNA polymerase I [Dehalococcoidia bacterium]|nr:DNA polymerase I [Dehalococcoidia bacterium]